MAERFAVLISEELYKELVKMPRNEAKKRMLAEKPEILKCRTIYSCHAVEAQGLFYIDYLFG